MAGARKALVVATYDYRDTGLRRLTAPEHDAESFAAVLEDPEVAGFDVTTLVNEPHHVVGEAIADFYAGCRRDDLALLYFSGHGLKDDEGRLHLAMSNTRREALLFTAISAAQLNDAMDASASRRKVLILDCCYSGAFPPGRSAKADEGVHTLERFQGKGRAVLTASDATQYAFEGDSLTGAGSASVFTRYLVEAIRTGAADLDEDGDIALDELYSYVHERVVAEMPQQRPKKQEDVDGRILIARNVHWTLPDHLRHAIESPIAAQRLSAVDGLGHLHRVGNDVVRAAVAERLAVLAADDSRSVSAAAAALLEGIDPAGARAEASTAAPVVPPPRVGERPSARAAAGRTAAAPAVRTPDTGTAPAERVESGSGGTAAPDPGASAPGPADSGVPPLRRAETSPAAAPGPDPDPGPAQVTGSVVPLVLSLVLVGGVLQLLSRFLIFETSYTVTAADAGQRTLPWVLAVALPVVGASVLLIARSGARRALALGAGLVGGAGLAQLDQSAATAAYWATPESSEIPGPGWWTALLGAGTLLAAAVVVLRSPGVRARPVLRRDWRAVVATAVVLGALGVRLGAFAEAWPWQSVNEPAILLALVCLPLTLLALGPAQRIVGLVAVTILGVWTSFAHVYAIADQSFPVDQPAAVLAVATALISVGACLLAQLGGPASRSSG